MLYQSRLIDADSHFQTTFDYFLREDGNKISNAIRQHQADRRDVDITQSKSGNKAMILKVIVSSMKKKALEKKRITPKVLINENDIKNLKLSYGKVTKIKRISNDEIEIYAEMD